MTEKLKPCPFCGSEPFTYEEDDSIYSLSPKILYKVACGKCDFTHYSKQDAIKAWNTRV